MHVYTENNQVRKMVLGKNHAYKTFINEILDVNTIPSCVFEETFQGKLKKINDNQYLKFCLKSLEEATGSLFIIGWSCNENDKHLIDVINKSNLEKLYVSYYSDKVKVKEKYQKAFPKKELIFFDAKIYHFQKNSE